MNADPLAIARAQASVMLFGPPPKPIFTRRLRWWRSRHLSFAEAEAWHLRQTTSGWLWLCSDHFDRPIAELFDDRIIMP